MECVGVVVGVVAAVTLLVAWTGHLYNSWVLYYVTEVTLERTISIVRKECSENIGTCREAADTSAERLNPR